MFEPAYIRLHRDGKLKERIDKALALLDNCHLCPRDCGVDRTRDEPGFCKTTRYARVASFSPHFGEEAPLVGRYGSGTIFFSSCNLLCSFCQNCDISHLRVGSVAGPDEIASMMLALAGSGCHNINFVTPTHVVPQILEALPKAIEAGLNLPLVYNTGAYDRVDTLRLLDGIIDIYMPDFKFWDQRHAETYCAAQDYPAIARAAIAQMHAQVGDLAIDEDGIARRGLLVRHLVMPGEIAGTSGIMRFLAQEISTDTYVNVMDQYHPCFKADRDTTINRRITDEEYTKALKAAGEAGITRLDSKQHLNILRILR
ncbi:MAG: radical SAM protein [Deltaproteobacteria bacterium]|nr:radical SAM protein [Deltaproteobacteria bacterium]